MVMVMAMGDDNGVRTAIDANLVKLVLLILDSKNVTEGMAWGACCNTKMDDGIPTKANETADTISLCGICTTS